MTAEFLTKSRHGTVYYFRRRVPTGAQATLGRNVLLRSLETADRRLAITRGRMLAAYTDAIFQANEYRSRLDMLAQLMARILESARSYHQGRHNRLSIQSVGLPELRS
jgi:hypothetical protein